MPKKVRSQGSLGASMRAKVVQHDRDGSRVVDDSDTPTGTQFIDPQGRRLIGFLVTKVNKKFFWGDACHPFTWMGVKAKVPLRLIHTAQRGSSEPPTEENSIEIQDLEVGDIAWISA